MDSSRSLISVCVPVFNEEQNIEPLYETVMSVMATVAHRYDVELVFTDNHSTDRTFSVIAELAKRDPRVRGLRFSRNFGFQRSIFTAYMNARGKAAVQIDCDLQDPPALILEFLRKWEEGYHVVYGVRRSREEGWWINSVRRLFYRLINLLSEDDLPLDAGDFRLVDRSVLDELRKTDDYQPYLRGTIAALGFEQVGIPYDRASRQRGESKFSFAEMLGLALDGILNHSVVPLRLSTYLGLGISVGTLLGTLAYLIGRIFLGKDWPPGFATLIIAVLLSLSLNAMFLGIIGEYLGRIYRQIKRRPLTIVEQEIDYSTHAGSRMNASAD
jgi:dolichol-phosphate mannosyltransferase